MYRLCAIFCLLLLALTAPIAAAQGDMPPAPLISDEGGPVAITGSVTYTNVFFTMGTAQPMVILEDQAGFVDRDRSFLFPIASQVLGQITSDFFTSPFTYSVSLPIEPQGTYRDVDNNGRADQGVQIYAIAYWDNTFGDAYLEARDQGGGGWSTAYASTRTRSIGDLYGEIIGGTLLVYAPDDQQGFPSGFGPDELLFTGDEPIVRLPQGYTLVNLDTDPFTFSRERTPTVDLIEGESQADDFSDLSYPEALDAAIDKMRREYAFTEYKQIDWDALLARFRPRFEQAQATNDHMAYRRALRDLAQSIPDGHVSAGFIIEDIQAQFGSGLGLALRELSDDRFLASFVLENGAAARAGIMRGAEILAINGVPISEAVDAIQSPFAPFSTEHNRRLDAARWVVRYPMGTRVEIVYRNPEAFFTAQAQLTSEFDWASFEASALTEPVARINPPVEYRLLQPDIAYVRINAFDDNSLLKIQLWERLIAGLNEDMIGNLIIDMRQNGGGSGWLANQMAAYFFDEALITGNTGFYNREFDAFRFDTRTNRRFILPSADLRYRGRVVVLVGPDCASACEFFSYNLTLQDRATIIGHYPTAGLGGSVQVFFMPGREQVRFTIGRAVDADGNIHIEGIGVIPDITVPITEETVLGDGDVLIDAAIDHLRRGGR